MTVGSSFTQMVDESRMVESEEIEASVILDHHENDKVVGVEFLAISSRVSESELSPIQLKAG